MNVNDVHYLLTFCLKNGFTLDNQKCEYEKEPIIENFIKWINKKHPNTFVYDNGILRNMTLVKPLDIIYYCIAKTNRNIFSDAVRKINKKYSAKVYFFLTDKDIYNSNKPFKKCCANSLVEYMINSTFFSSRANHYLLGYELSKKCAIGSYLTDNDFDNLKLGFLINQLYLYIDKNHYMDINEILSTMQMYFLIKLHSALAVRIHDLIFKILNKKVYRINILSIYQALIKFNVLTEDELKLIKRKESRLVIKSL